MKYHTTSANWTQFSFEGEISMAKLKTGRHTSALKANRQAIRHAEHNLEIRSKIRTIARKVEEAVKSKDAKAAKTFLNEAFQAWDKAAKTGIIHWRAASRKKSRLSGRVNTLATAKA
jgi:small subunit ribosomal protein S20